MLGSDTLTIAPDIELGPECPHSSLFLLKGRQQAGFRATPPASRVTRLEPRRSAGTASREPRGQGILRGSEAQVQLLCACPLARTL